MVELFKKYQAQTSNHSINLVIKKAKGCYIYDENNKPYLDFIAGVSVCNLGHRPKYVIQSIRKQLNKYLHVMVYGEYIQSPSLKLCKTLAKLLPSPLSCTYLLNSGTEAIEVAMKLSKRVTGRFQILSATNAYHGNTQGSMSLLGVEYIKKKFRPLIPGIDFISFNNFKDLEKITKKTAAIVLETIQGGGGFILPHKGYLKAIRKRCNETKTLLVLDEIQSGFGRTGNLFAFQEEEVIPDILVMGKSMASGLPIGAITTSNELMSSFSTKPMLGHITTFGGNPVIATAALATIKYLEKSSIMAEINAKEEFVRSMLKHKFIIEVRGKGLMLAIITQTSEIASFLIKESRKNGLLLFFLLYEPRAVRITPPLIITYKELQLGCEIILETLNKYKNK